MDWCQREPREAGLEVDFLDCFGVRELVESRFPFNVASSPSHGSGSLPEPTVNQSQNRSRTHRLYENSLIQLVPR